MNRQEPQQRNRKADFLAVIDPFPLGAHLMAERCGYLHQGIYAGNGKVIHYAGFSRALRRGPVEEISLEGFAGGHHVSVSPAPSARYAGPEAARRARTRLGENEYPLLTNNCEHFCAWCLFGESRSEQVEACLRHPGAAARSLVSLFMTFLAIEWRGIQPSLRGGDRDLPQRDSKELTCRA